MTVKVSVCACLCVCVHAFGCPRVLLVLCNPVQADLVRVEGALLKTLREEKQDPSKDEETHESQWPYYCVHMCI